MAIKSVLKPENSIVAGLATVGLVYGIYQLDAGTVAQVSLTEPYTPAVNSSIKKAGYTSLVLVTGVALIARDANIAILGGATIIAMQAHYRHANAVGANGHMVPPSDSAYAPASASPNAQVPLSAVG